MTLYSEDPNKESTSELFYKKIIYDNDSKTLGYDNLVDFNFAEKCLYGRVTPRFVPMESTFGRYGAKGLPRKQTQEKNATAINFVADAFAALSQEFDRCALTNKIDTRDPFLSSLKIYKSYTKPRILYQGNQKNYTAALKQSLKQADVQLATFDQFIKELMRSLKKTAHTFPFTYPGYIKSRRCSILVSGLALDIADLDPNNDQEKIDNFINSNNWEFYLNACRSYGFMVDRHIPWRLVADIASSPMIEYASKYGTNSTPEVFVKYYTPAHQFYYNTFKRQLLTIYNRIKPTYITTTEECQGTTISTTTESANYTLSSLKLKFSEEFFLETYFRIRFLEEESKFSEEEKSLLIDDLLEIKATQTSMIAVGQFEKILNKPFDYLGSLSYINKRRKILLATE
ncbi:hypothetical protein CMI47_17150 [Candidatus Pacearchaeota archaeon]|nr:hypothetical protein [Candidatus Pacearchaeota archaeon]|tara:strand:- start:1979 stop:3178 length:1200 start_codon:yes stop_codon:yes gene_type:complete